MGESSNWMIWLLSWLASKGSTLVLLRLPLHVSCCRMRLSHLFFQIRWMCWAFSMCPANACGKRTCVWRSSGVGFLRWPHAFAARKIPCDPSLLLLLFQQSSCKPSNKYYSVGRNLSASTRLPHAFARHMESQLLAVSACGAATVCRNRTHEMAASVTFGLTL